MAAAPGRVNLIGEHTDYNDGFVLPMALDRRTVVAAGPRVGSVLSLCSAELDETVELDLSRPLVPRPGHWSSYAAGVVAGVKARGASVPGLDVVIESDVPLGAGLSSSAAFEVAMATLLEEITGDRLDPREKARLCQRAEHDFAGVPSGIMDQLVAVLGRAGSAVRIDCRSLEVDYLDLSDPQVTVMIVNSNVRHDLADGAYADRRAACHDAARVLGVRALRDANLEDIEMHARALGPVLVRRARHVVSENARVLGAADAFRRGDWDEAGRLMYRSHESLRDDFEVSCPELDTLVEIAVDLGRAGGVFGCRMTGGGFGGSVVCLVQSEAAADVSAAFERSYRERTGRTATVLSSRPGGGAEVLY